MPEWIVAVCVALGTAIAACVPRLIHDSFYYSGDMLESFIPSWYHLGTELRDGNWLVLDPDAWVGGNYAGEAAYGLYNPVNLANYILTSWFENLSVAAFVVMTEFLALFAAATYLLCREYGARRLPSVVAAFAMPFSGFTLFYEAGGWPSGMMAVAWVTLFWWSALRLAHGRANPFTTFVIGALTVSMGNPYAALGAVIVLLGLAIELATRRRVRRLVLLVVTGACAGTAALATFLPLYLSVDVTTRADSTGITNNTFLQPQIGGLASMSSPSHLPVIMTFGGAVEVLPSLYLAWFVLPLLPWLRWDRLGRLVRSPSFRRGRGRALVGLAVVTLVFFVFTFGPSDIGMFRWPIRLVEYLYLALMVWLALAVSLGLARDRVRVRAALSAATIALGFYLAWSATPEIVGRHALFALGVALGCVAAYFAARAWGPGGLAAVAVAVTVAVTAGQVYSLTKDTDSSGGPDPSSTDTLADATSGYRGTVLQLADRELAAPSDLSSGRLLFGNEIMSTPVEASINTYSGIGFLTSQTALCMDYRGEVCAELYPALWEPVNPDIDIPLVDYLRVSTLVVQHELVPEVDEEPAPEGWSVLERDDVRTVLVRDDPLPLPGDVAHTAPGVTVDAAENDTTTETLHVRGDGGAVRLARLAWPGYTATVDGTPIPAVEGWHGLLEITVPPGEHEVELHFTPPRQRLSGAAFALAAAVMVVVGAGSGVLSWRGRSRRTAR
ncbi:YfhO family protein [Rhodococcus sp. HNM0569]|nr:YfhO family protein [Rhodococcus sp. HNM0569]